MKRLVDKVRRKRAQRLEKRKKWAARSIQRCWRAHKAWDGEAGWRLLMESAGGVGGADLLESIRPAHREKVKLQLVRWERCAVRMQVGGWLDRGIAGSVARLSLAWRSFLALPLALLLLLLLLLLFS